MSRQTDRGRFPFSARHVAAIILVLLSVIFILQNRRRMTIRFLIPELEAPLWVALFVSVLVGMIAGALLTYRRKG